MPLDFPNTPTDGQIYDNYYWDTENGVWNSLGNYEIPNILSNGTFTASSGTTVPLTVTGASGQSANLQEWKSQAGATLASMSANGGLSLNSPLSVQNGGTGASTHILNGYLKGNGSSTITSQTGIPAGDISSGTLSQARGGTGQETLLAAIQALGIGDYAAKSGPASYVSSYRVNWAKGYGQGSSLNWSSYADGIYVNATGHYEIWGVQRGAQTNYSGIGISGDRTALENRTNGIWSHDHAGDDSGQGWSKSYFLGQLNAGELVTFGGAANNMTLSTSGFAGFLSIKRVR
jgi:hypothetical protein